MMRRLPSLFRPFALFGAIGATLIGLAWGTGSWAAGGERHGAWSWNGTLVQGRALEINGVNGEIVAEPGTGDRVEVTADKHGRKHDPAEVTIKVVEDSDGITICAIYPNSTSPCDNREDRSHSHNNSDVAVDFHVKVPSGAQFKAATVNGGVHVHSLDGPVKARTVNGTCDIETSRSGEASTVNGSVRAVLGKVSASDELAFSTVNGSITLRLPTTLDADLTASTVNGHIESDFPVTVTGKWGPRSMHGTIGRGGTRLTASTVNGGIKFEKTERATAQ
jgi:hypothetical protein